LYNTNKYYNQLQNKKNGKQVEDKWILSKLNSLIKKVTEDLENYKVDFPFKEIQNFVINDFSRNYIKMTRNREDTKKIVGEVLKNVSLLLAPFAPYITEKIYSQFSKNSVHLSKWPKADEKKINKKLEESFDSVLEMIERGFAERDKAKIGLKWPLAKATIFCDKKIDKKLERIIKSQLNVKKIMWKKSSEKDWKVELDTVLTPELESEGYAREMSRQVQAFRKKLGLEKRKKIKLSIFADDEFKNVLEKQKEFIKKRTNSKELEIVTTDKERFKNNTYFRIKDKRGKIAIIC